MIISKTPYRASFFGGGTDYPDYYHNYPGSVLSTTIDKYCYITCRALPAFFEYKTRIVYSAIELIKSIDEIKHPSVRETLRYSGISEGLEIHHDGDLPARTGLGSSSSFTVGLMNALYAYQGKMADKETLAKDAILIEQKMIKEDVGSQDQIAAAYGGFNRIDFHANDTFSVHPVIMPASRKKQLEDNLLLFYTGISRFAPQIAGEQIKNIPSKNAELGYMYKMVDEGINILSGDGDINDFGRLLNETWRLKRGLSSKIATSYIDEIYDAALKAGAIGGKLLGAGGGGFMIFYVEGEKQSSVRKALANLMEVPFGFENEGSRIIYYTNLH